MAPPPERARRVAVNESLVRDVNERIGEGAKRFEIEHGTDFLCECADVECSDRLRLTFVEYDEVRAHGNRFFVTPGHEVLDVERVVAEGDGYCIVEKIGLGAEVARELDPRS